MHVTNLYPHFHSCFISMWPQVGGLPVPIGIILVVNTVIFIRVIRRLGRTVKGRSVDKTEERHRLRRLQNAAMIMILMGLTWSVGYLSIIWPGSAVVQGKFAVLNSLQGYLIFMLYCVRQPLLSVRSGATSSAAAWLKPCDRHPRGTHRVRLTRQTRRDSQRKQIGILLAWTPAYPPKDLNRSLFRRPHQRGCRDHYIRTMRTKCGKGSAKTFVYMGNKIIVSNRYSGVLRVFSFNVELNWIK